MIIKLCNRLIRMEANYVTNSSIIEGNIGKSRMGTRAGELCLGFWGSEKVLAEFNSTAMVIFLSIFKTIKK